MALQIHSQNIIQPDPNPSSITNQLIIRCGKLADRVLDSLLKISDSFQPSKDFPHRTENLSKHSLAWLAWEPLWEALQYERAECPHCSPLGRLSVLAITDSGSTAEGLSDHATGLKSSSDFDYMYELGPLNWYNTSQNPAPPKVPLDRQSDPSVPLLIAMLRSDRRAVRLWQVPTSKCEHTEPLEFRPASMRQLMYDMQRVRHVVGEVTITGPASAVSQEGELYAGVDHVPCLRFPIWPPGEFLSRPRKNDWPPEAARKDICEFGAHVVPIGAHGTPGQLSEWRISFSRADVVAAWHMTAAQRAAAKAAKKCKNEFKVDGECVLKSFFIKTAVFWLCQDADVSNWNSITQAVRMILEYLERAVANKRLECFFWPDVNLFQNLTPCELDEMSRTVQFMKRDMIRILMSECAVKLRDIVMPILEYPGEPVAEDQLDRYLARVEKDEVKYGWYGRPNPTRWGYRCGSGGMLWGISEKMFGSSSSFVRSGSEHIEMLLESSMLKLGGADGGSGEWPLVQAKRVQNVSKDVKDECEGFEKELEKQCEYDLEMLLLSQLDIKRETARKWAGEWRKAALLQICNGVLPAKYNKTREVMQDHWNLRKYT